MMLSKTLYDEYVGRPNMAEQKNKPILVYSPPPTKLGRKKWHTFAQRSILFSFWIVSIKHLNYDQMGFLSQIEELDICLDCSFKQAQAKPKNNLRRTNIRFWFFALTQNLGKICQFEPVSRRKNCA